VAVIAFGAALLLSSNSVWHLFRAKQAMQRFDAMQTHSGGAILAGEMASGSAALQCLAGLAAIVLGIVAVTGTNPMVLTLVGLLVLGATVLLTGSTLTGAVMGFMEPAVARRPGSFSQSPGIGE
jgi:cytochrome c biogenesis protein CcdA